jgi:hypothetical protein
MAVAGTYDVSIKTPMGDQKGKLTVEPAGDGFTGRVSNAMMGAMEITDGKVSGDTLTWTMDMKVPMPMTLECQATVNGNAIAGAIKAGMFGSMDLTGTRAG